MRSHNNHRQCTAVPPLLRGVLRIEMKQTRKTTALTRNGVAVAFVGLSLIVGGVLARSANMDIRQMFHSGKWSVASVNERIGIQSTEDLANERERSLLTALSRTNEQCIGLAELCVEMSSVFLLIGACLLFMGGRTIWLARGIEKEDTGVGR